jgi:hypothetical protein
VCNVPHAPVGAALLAGKPGGQDTRTARASNTLQQGEKVQREGKK